MIPSVRNVDENFYALFAGAGSTSLPVLTLQDTQGNSFEVKVVYARKSLQDRTEEFNQTYPLISILNYTPTLREGYYFPYQPTYGNFRDVTGSGKVDTASIIPDPVPLDFRYDVYVACKSEPQWSALKQWFFRQFRFDKQKNFVFNAISVTLSNAWSDTEVVGDRVYYDFSFSDIPRSDGVFETLFQFNVKPWLQFQEMEDFAALQDLIIQPQPISKP